MTKNKTSTAKISQPKLSNIFPRQRLFKELDNSRKRPISWITGPAGSGKTMLVASYLDARKLPCIWYKVDTGDADIATFFYYMGLAARQATPAFRTPMPLLTPEYTQGIPVFTRRYFEELFRRLKPPYTLVLDNYQELPAHSESNELLVEGLASIPEKINVMIISRNEPPSAYVRLKANRQIAQIGWKDIRFTEEESKELVQQKERRPLPDRILSLLHKKTNGWAVGLVLMIESIKIQDMDYDVTDGLIPKDIFEYFAGEIFKKTDEETQLFLLKSAFLPEMNARSTKELIGVHKAGQILSGLHEKNYFMEMHQKNEPVYIYHPLFREFLLTRMKESQSPEDVLCFQKRAATILEEAGRIEDAVHLFREAKDWDNLVRIILGNAPSFLSQGRIKTLDEWLGCIPAHITESIPWLLYWKGNCRLPDNPQESRSYFEKAFQLFEIQKDDAGALLAWSGAVNAFFYELDDLKPLDAWIDWLDERICREPSFPAPEIELSVAASMIGALVWRRPDHPEIRSWIKRALSLAPRSMNTVTSLQAYMYALNYYSWMGDWTGCKIVLDDMKRMISAPGVTPMAVIFSKMMEANYYTSVGGGSKRTLQLVTEGLSMAEETGIHVVDPWLWAQGAYGALNKGDTGLIKEYVAKLKDMLGGGGLNARALYYNLAALQSLFNKDITDAVAFAEKAFTMAQESGTPVGMVLGLTLLAQAVFETGDYQRATKELAAAQKLALPIGSKLYQFMRHFIRAYFAFKMGQESEGADALGEAMRLGRQAGYTIVPHFWQPGVLALLCAKALEIGIEVEYASGLISTLKLIPDTPPVDLENWPWPVKIYTLGRFTLVKDGEAAGLSGKTQKKPLLMLKAIIALGGDAVRKERIIDALWPDAEGDVGQIAFHTTISRLRRLVGEEAIALQGGKVSLNTHYCWVDIWAFERLCGRMNSTDNKEQDSLANRSAADRAVNLYQGTFLPADAECFFTISSRERLRSQYLQLIARMGSVLEKAQDWQAAAAYYGKGLAADPITEEFYQGLMNCNIRLGRKAEAMIVYQRCRKALRTELGVAPSEKTEALGREMLKC